MGGYAKPFFILIERIMDYPDRRRRRKRLEENIQFLRDCKHRGVSPYDELERMEREQKKRGGGTD